MTDYNQKYLSRARRFAELIQVLPFIRAVVLNGSVAQNKAVKSSDIDLLIIARDGRIFTCRLLVNLVAILLRTKRPFDESKPHGGKFCFNYFMTESYLQIPTGRGEKMDEYCKDNYSKSILLAGDKTLFHKFMITNKYVIPAKAGIQNKELDPRVKPEDDSGIGFFEKMLKRWQIAKIESDPRTAKYPDLIVYNDRELRFHPPKKAGKRVSR